jgi:hypothetical protein
MHPYQMLLRMSQMILEMILAVMRMTPVVMRMKMEMTRMMKMWTLKGWKMTTVWWPTMGTTTTIKTMRMAMTMVMIRVMKIGTVERSIICTLILLQMVSSVIY